MTSRSARERRRNRSRNNWQPLSPAEELAALAPGRAESPPPWQEHPTLVSLRERLQLACDCWNLLDAPDGTSRRSVYLPPGIQEPDSSYRKRIETARPIGFFRDALRTYTGMISFLHWQALPPTLQQVIGDVDGHGTDLGVFLFIADLLVLRDGGCLILVLRGVRLSLSRLAPDDCSPRDGVLHPAEPPDLQPR